MSPALAKLVSLLLLIVQGVIASSPGRVLCIPLGDCGQHHESASSGCGHCGPIERCSDVGQGGRQDHEHGPFDATLHSDDECGCHIHFPVPAKEQLPSNPKDDTRDLRSVFMPLVVAITLVWDFKPPLFAEVCIRPPDFNVSDQVRGLKATRLLI